MSFFHKDDEDEGTTTLRRKVMDHTMQLSRDLVMPHMLDFESLSDTGKRERIADLILAMAYAQAVFARVFLKTTPEDFGKQMGKLVEDTLRVIKEHSPNTADLLGTSGWD